MKIAILQLNPTIGDLEGNASKIIDSVLKHKKDAIDLFVTPELGLIGYPAKDLILNHYFLDKAWLKAVEIARRLRDCPSILIGTVIKNKSESGRPTFNSAVLLQQGKVTQIFYKSLIPTYDVFEEGRYFESGGKNKILLIKDNKIGVTICEDIWNDKDFWNKRRYHIDPVLDLSKKKVDYIINLSASPFSLGRQKTRESMLSLMAKKYKIPFIYINQIGGNDDLVFDGRSFVVNYEGKIIAKAKPFSEDVLTVDFDSYTNRITDDNLQVESEAWQALVLGTKDYVKKCGFKKVILGLSGGIDSSLVAAIAVEAFGSQNVLGVLMPSLYTSNDSVLDAEELAENLGIKTLKIPISDLLKNYNNSLKEAFKGYFPDITEENIQARIRGNLLMALSNKYGSLVLSTGNKSELAVGYCTLYGDLSGGLGVISDVPKTLVYKIAKWVNKNNGNVIPKRTLTKDPTAELKPNQKDQDILPPYEILDKILKMYIDRHKSKEEIINTGLSREIVDKTINLIHNAEFKRKQAPVGVRITDRAFGTGWKMPIAAQY